MVSEARRSRLGRPRALVSLFRAHDPHPPPLIHPPTHPRAERPRQQPQTTTTRAKAHARCRVLALSPSPLTPKQPHRQIKSGLIMDPPHPPPNHHQQQRALPSSSKAFEEQHVVARLERRGIPAPASWTDSRSVALTLAALQAIIEATKAEVNEKKQRAAQQQQQQEAQATPSGSRGKQQGVAELSLSIKAYEKEIEKLQGRLRTAKREAEALEALGPPCLDGGGGGGGPSDPIRLLEEIRRKAQAALAQRERIMTKGEEEEARLLREGEGVGGPLSDAPREEAKRLVARKWMGGGRRRSSFAPHYTEELID